MSYTLTITAGPTNPTPGLVFEIRYEDADTLRKGLEFLSCCLSPTQWGTPEEVGRAMAAALWPENPTFLAELQGKGE